MYVEQLGTNRHQEINKEYGHKFVEGVVKDYNSGLVLGPDSFIRTLRADKYISVNEDEDDLEEE